MLRDRLRTSLVLVCVILTALISGLIFREMMIKDFQRYLTEGNQHTFMERAGNLVIAWSFVWGNVLAAGILLSRKLVLSYRKTVQAGTAAPQGEPKMTRTAIPGNQDLRTEAAHEHIAEEKSSAQAHTPVIPEAVHQEDSESVADDAFDADEEDVQPLIAEPDRIKKIVDGLEELAKAQSAAQSLRKQRLELEQFLAGLLDTARRSAGDKDIAFNLECEKGLPLSADPAYIERILNNLLDNAVKAVKKSGTVTMTASENGNDVLLSVRDTGTGIKRQHLPHIFDLFFRGAGSGIGLGLAIVKELAAACGGNVEVKTERGKGSVFTVRVPSA